MPTDTTLLLTHQGYTDVRMQVNALDLVYYSDPDRATVSDAEYDKLFDSLLHYEDVTGVVHPESPTLRVAGRASKDDIAHGIPMLSLKKVTTAEEIAAFVRLVGRHSILVEPKYDGASLSLRYEDGVMVQALTRGDGAKGQDVTENARNIAGVHDIGDFTGTVRGEVLISRKDFEAVNEGRETKFANARNAAAGALTHSDPREARRRRLRFYVYDVYGDENAWDFFDLRGEPLEFMCPTPGSLDKVLECVEGIMSLRPELEFETDGVVLKVAEHPRRDELGSKDRYPNWAVAFKDKSTQERAEATLLGVTWQVGTGGAVTPVAEVQPTECGGTVIRRITLHNTKFILDNDLHMGCTLIITRAGDVIPQVVGRVEGPPGTLPPVPKECPSCGTRLTRYGNSSQLRCAGLNCEAQIVGKLVHWASSEAMDIDAIGPKVMEKFVRDIGIHDVSELYTINKEELLDLEGVKETSADRFLASLAASKDRGMARVLFGLAIPEVGEGTAKRLARSYASVEEVAGSTVADLMSIKDIGEVAAQSIAGWFATASNYEVIKALHKHGVVMDAPMLAQSTSEAKTFVLTGSIEGYSNRKAFAEVLEGLGWTMQSGVSKTTDLLITDDTKVSTKAKKAASLGVTVTSSVAALELAHG